MDDINGFDFGDLNGGSADKKNDEFNFNFGEGKQGNA